LPSFRDALRRPWRDPKTAFPVLLTALVIVFSLIPWNFAEMNPHGSGPALAGRLVEDKREHLTLFSYMDDLESYIADQYEFTLLRVNEEGTAAYYDIRRVTGDEERRATAPGKQPAR